MSRPNPNGRDNYSHFVPITTRWADNDVYGHINNVTYYAFFDTAVNTYLIQEGVVDPGRGDTIGLVVETACNYFAPLAFPAPIEAGIKLARLGTSSATYEVGIFAEKTALAAAQGHFTHVYVDSLTRRPVPVSADFRAVLQKIF